MAKLKRGSVFWSRSYEQAFVIIDDDEAPVYEVFYFGDLKHYKHTLDRWEIDQELCMIAMTFGGAVKNEARPFTAVG